MLSLHKELAEYDWLPAAKADVRALLKLAPPSLLGVLGRLLPGGGSSARGEGGSVVALAEQIDAVLEERDRDFRGSRSLGASLGDVDDDGDGAAGEDEEAPCEAHPLLVPGFIVHVSFALTTAERPTSA